MQLKECGICHRVGYRAFVPWGDAGWCCARDDLCQQRKQQRLNRWLRRLSSQQQVSLIERYQNDGRMHPMTCGRDSQHVLVPRVLEGAIILRCSECDYDQRWIPWETLMSYALWRGLLDEEG